MSRFNFLFFKRSQISERKTKDPWDWKKENFIIVASNLYWIENSEKVNGVWFKKRKRRLLETIKEDCTLNNERFKIPTLNIYWKQNFRKLKFIHGKKIESDL